MIRIVYLGHGIFIWQQLFLFFLPNQFLGEVLSSQNEEPQKKKWSTSTVARVFIEFK